jgi:hypothetical protein
MFDRRLALVAVVAGLCGAVLIDLYLIVTETFVIRNATPLLVMQWDASNALGMAAYRGGWETAALGTLMHFAVSIIWGALYVAAAVRVRWFVSHPIAGGVLLGVVAMSVMRVVIHLGHAIVRPFPNALSFSNILIAHIVFFGIPVALVASRLLRNRALRAV